MDERQTGSDHRGDEAGKSLLAACNQHSLVSHAVAVLSGKGGVGKSTVTSLIAARLVREGYSTAIIDADITGSSIPRMFGLRQRLRATEVGIEPARSCTGIGVVSLNLLLDREDAPVMWRGPLLSRAVRQFWTDTSWGKVDYLLVDLPPGTSDAPLTVMQAIPLEGAVVVSSPQQLASMIVKKAVNMTEALGVRALGLIENMAYARCPRCGEEFHPFGLPSGPRLAEETGLCFLGSLPIDPQLSSLADEGRIESYTDASGQVDRIVQGLLRRLDRSAASGQVREVR